MTAIVLTASAATIVPGPVKQALAAEAARESANHAAAPLDGQSFRASIVRATPAEQSKELADTLMFSDGMFASALCRKFNFSDAPYFIRRVGNSVQFQAEMSSPTDGRMVWKGTIEGNTLKGTMRWTKERWYWTIDTEHEIRGTLEKATRGAHSSAE